MADFGRHPSVKALDESKRLPLLVSWRLRREQRRSRTGVLLFAEIREPVRSLTHKAGIVSLWEDGVELCSRTRDAKMPKFVELSPGLHRLEFKVTRMRAGKSTSFLKVVDLQEGEILVALCDPVQSNVFYRRSPDADTWAVGVRSRRDPDLP
ncbi:hypothetical protein SRB17_90150 [Streptomyces sp. RB17]|uniref:hypothetical protein n=1 Tax=Streptomyces sp. RB17 TaxID=2585197 RepID=UPI001305A82D|nr:hypothetical protein [Streptomyces sp. RB17]MQY40978.1 hypothetical protein [Streptomyces sp. RB17]